MNRTMTIDNSLVKQRGRMVMEKAMVINGNPAEVKNTDKVMEDKNMKKTREVVAAGLEILKDVRHQWAEAERYHPHRKYTD